MNGMQHAQFDPLQAFANWWATQPMLLMAGTEPVERLGPVSLATLYRDDEFQVQLAVCDPNSEITEHSHPGVELIKVYLSGQIYFCMNGQPVITPENIKPQDQMRGAMLRMSPGDTHSAKIGPMGGTFMTLQRHLSKVKSLSLCWGGDALDEHHAARLTFKK